MVRFIKIEARKGKYIYYNLDTGQLLNSYEKFMEFLG
jgi:hypothetical protein